jgi:hypothetical protein
VVYEGERGEEIEDESEQSENPEGEGRGGDSDFWGVDLLKLMFTIVLRISGVFGVCRLSLLGGGTRLQFREIRPPTILHQ